MTTRRTLLAGAPIRGYFTTAQVIEFERFLERLASWSLEDGGIATFPESA
jgi:hypothetical protein